MKQDDIWISSDEIPRATPETLLLLRVLTKLRKLAREAVIFGLMGWVISLAGSIYFIYQNQGAPAPAASPVALSTGGTEDGSSPDGSFAQGVPKQGNVLSSSPSDVARSNGSSYSPNTYVPNPQSPQEKAREAAKHRGALPGPAGPASHLARTPDGTEDISFPDGSYAQGAPSGAVVVAKQTESPRHWPEAALLALRFSLIGYFVGLLVWAFFRMTWFAFHG